MIITLVDHVSAGTTIVCVGVTNVCSPHVIYHGAIPLTLATPPILSTRYPLASPLLNVRVLANAWV